MPDYRDWDGLAELRRELSAQIDGVNDMLSNRLAAVETRTLDLDARVVNNRGFVRNPFFVNRAAEEAAEAFRRLVEWFAIPGAESIRAGRLAAMIMQQVADLRAEKIHLQNRCADLESAVLAGVGSLIDEVLERRIENERLQSELDELLGSEFFKIGERLRRGTDLVIKSDLRNLLLGPERFRLILLLDRAYEAWDDNAAQGAVMALADWLSRLGDWSSAHFELTASEAGDLVDAKAKMTRFTHASSTHL